MIIENFLFKKITIDQKNHLFLELLIKKSLTQYAVTHFEFGTE